MNQLDGLMESRDKRVEELEKKVEKLMEAVYNKAITD